MKSYEAIKPNMHELISVSRAETMNKLDHIQLYCVQFFKI